MGRWCTGAVSTTVLHEITNDIKCCIYYCAAGNNEWYKVLYPLLCCRKKHNKYKKGLPNKENLAWRDPVSTAVLQKKCDE